MRREKSGAYGWRWLPGSSKIWRIPSASHSPTRSIHSRPSGDRTFWNTNARSTSTAAPTPATSSSSRSIRPSLSSNASTADATVASAASPRAEAPMMPWSSALAGRALTLRQSLFPQVVKGAPTVREPKRVGRLLPLSAMADYREILHERLYVRVPGTDKLRKTAANRHKHLLANGWRELEREPGRRPHHGQVRAHGSCPDEGSPAQAGARDPHRTPSSPRRQPSWRRQALSHPFVPCHA